MAHALGSRLGGRIAKSAASASTADGMANGEPEDAEDDKDAAARDAEDAWSDELSDVSDNSDLERTAVDEQKTWTTEQDEDLARIDHVASLLRDRPLLPADPSDPKHERPYGDYTSGIAFPRCHCAFKGCTWSSNEPLETSEQVLARHIHSSAHLRDMRLGAGRSFLLGVDASRSPFMDYYEEAIMAKEREGMAAVGPIHRPARVHAP